MSADLAVPFMDEGDARRLTERIRYCALSVRDGMEKLQTLVAQAQEGNAHLALVYKSWTAYLADVLGDEPLRLARDERRELVSWLAGEGMSTRAIAPIVGANQATVVRDLTAGDAFASPESAPSAATPDEAPVVDLANVDMATGEILDHPAPRPVTGMDGKTYTRPTAPAQPKRRPLTDAARDVALDLRKITERIERIAGDDRFAANKNEVAAHLRHHLAHAIKVLTDLDNTINN